MAGRTHINRVIVLYFAAAPGHPADKLDLRAPVDRLSHGDAVGDFGPDATSPAKPNSGD